jgi:hypothetical protein
VRALKFPNIPERAVFIFHNNKNMIIKKTLIIIQAIAVLCLTGIFQCKKDIHLSPPRDGRVLSFTKNTYVKNRVIYQSQADSYFRKGEISHVYWAGITGGNPSRLLHVQILNSIPEIYFTLSFPESKRKIFCKAGTEKSMTGCSIPGQAFKENEFIIEVMAPQGVKFRKDPEYRLFIGIEADKPLTFYQDKRP